jgi:Uncharacterised protein family (UPF0175)
VLPWLGGYAAPMKRTVIEIHEGAFAGLDRNSTELAAEFRATAAAKWYEVGRVSQEVAAQIAGVEPQRFPHGVITIQGLSDAGECRGSRS